MNYWIQTGATQISYLDDDLKQRQRKSEKLEEIERLVVRKFVVIVESATSYLVVNRVVSQDRQIHSKAFIAPFPETQ